MTIYAWIAAKMWERLSETETVDSPDGLLTEDAQGVLALGERATVGAET